MALSAAIIGTLPKAARAQISPGPLHAAHAALEGVENCSRCHVPKSRSVAEQCLTCHTFIAESRQNRRGLHGREDYRECQLCHVDHQGRDYELVWWKDGLDKFDHALTGYNLQGRHRQTACRSCHKPELIVGAQKLVEKNKDLTRTFLGLNTTCTSCHFDEHRAQFTQSCNTCHTNDAWTPAPGFDHAKTKYPLTGRHVEVACIKCHPPRVEPFNPTDSAYIVFAGSDGSRCVNCHADVHEKRLGQKCEDCHATTGWKTLTTTTFDHGRTRYPLTQKHLGVKCESCHKPDQPHRGLKYDLCTDCHSDRHNGQFAERSDKGACTGCHSLDGFLPARFTLADHEKTDYPLAGAHFAVRCVACHVITEVAGGKTVTAYTFASTRCAACHRDPHQAKLKQKFADSGCELCHAVDGWKAVAIGHDETEFKLTDRHTAVACLKCHPARGQNGSTTDFAFAGIGTLCRDCHDDIHAAQFAVESPETETGAVTTCSRCHTPAHWIAEKFDHNRDSSYPLDGAHRRVACDKCHPTETVAEQPTIRYKPLGKVCSACHGDRYVDGSEVGG